MTSYPPPSLPWPGRLILACFLVLAGTSFVPLDGFLASGAYERARAAAADCSQPFVPALRPADRPVGRIGASRLASLSVRSAGARLAHSYRQLDRSSVRHEVRDLVEVGVRVEGAAVTRYDSYEGPTRAMSVLSARTPDGACARIVILLDPATIQVGRKGATVPTNMNLERFEGLTPQGYEGDATIEAIEPGQGEVVVKVYKGGQSARDINVRLKTGAPGAPGRYGSTIGHEHLAGADADLGSGAFPAQPTIRIDGQQSPGQEVVAVTDTEGTIRFNVYAGYRGGPEVIEAHATIGGEEFSVARSVIVKTKHDMTHFIKDLGYAENPEPSARFPFLATGWTERHYYNHWLRAGKAQEIVSALKTVWSQDSARRAHTERTGTAHYIALGDMSLEYGGIFSLSAGACTESDWGPGRGGHLTHRSGLSVDVVPCYTNGPQPVSPGACRAGRGVKIDETLLVAHVLGRLGGTIRIHGPSIDGVPYHYHIRLPE